MFDTSTRNKLASFVGKARKLLCGDYNKPGGEITSLLQTFGIQPDGAIADLESVPGLDQTGYELGHTLRDILAHKHAQSHDKKTWGKYDAAVYDLLQEQSFTILNRLCALRMAEERGIILPCVSQGMDSDGFVLYDGNQKDVKGITDKSHFDRDTRYQHFLFSMFDELAIDLGTLFDRSSPHSLIFPRPEALGALLDLLNDRELTSLWAQDETIGWIYQYWNSKEERKAMRDASAAPRNSRELAVRNQFFTPRYVVEFLTDNTLGRIWYEMTRGQSRLAEQCRYLVRRPTEIFLAEGETAPETPDQDGLSQEELLKQPVHILHRPLKDPREIRLLDPACGSMHFGLYAFDLFETIYEEAWDNGSCPALQDGYATRDEFLKDVPRLIIEHNIHGIDIDPRAVQIAGLSLWLRAQKAWQARGVKPAERPRVRRSSIVCAEPMPGSPEMLEEFVATLKPDLLGELVKTVFDKMQLAGEAGSLLKIEEEIRTAIDTARKEWLKQQDDLLTRKDGGQEEFFDTAEQQVIDALRAYAEQADSDSYQRRLFADDAARGFAFIDLCRKRYDAVVMNPPFGEYQDEVRTYYYSCFPSSRNDLIGMFIERCLDLSRGGFVGAISSRTVFFLTTFEPLRATRFLADDPTFLIADLGKDVMDNAMVEAAAYCMASGVRIQTDSIFIQALNPEDRDKRVLESLADLLTGGCSDGLYITNLKLFGELENSPFCYWASPAVVSLFGECARLESGARRVRVGLQTGDDFRYIRTWWEIPCARSGWVPHPKGGETMRFAADVHLRVNWTDDGKELRSDRRARVQNVPFYFSPGITSSYRCLYYSPALFPSGMITGVAGSAIYCGAEDLWWLLGLGNSRAFDSLIKLRLGSSEAGIIQVGHLQASPVPAPNLETRARLESLARDGWRSQLTSFRQNEIAWNFVCPVSNLEVDNRDLDGLLRNIDAVAAEAYGIPEQDFFVLAGGTTVSTEDADGVAVSEERIIPYSLGCTFGRWDIRFATGERQPPELPDPFDPLPVCPPGMLQNAEGLPAEPKDVPADYPLRISWPGILVDDENHPEDIVARVREAIEVIWKDRAEVIEQEACEIIGVKTLRDYFRRPAAFFADHLKRYSKSRRQAPIYWPLSTKSGSYTLWLYCHRLSNDTLYAAVTQFVEPKIEEAKRTHARLHEKSDARSKLEDKTYEETTQLIGELATFREELLRIAGFWKPNLNDGVQITAAPLWSLFALNTWQNKLKGTWQDLEKGKYDWAHLAYSIWPERVAKGCEKDRSIAIAHGLEHLCKVEPPKAKKKAKGKAVVEEDEVDSELIGED
jgi:hypothetical protein